MYSIALITRKMYAFNLKEILSMCVNVYYNTPVGEVYINHKMWIYMIQFQSGVVSISLCIIDQYLHDFLARQYVYRNHINSICSALDKWLLLQSHTNLHVFKKFIIRHCI